jgi:hypothetical protein
MHRASVPRPGFAGARNLAIATMVAISDAPSVPATVNGPAASVCDADAARVPVIINGPGIGADGVVVVEDTVLLEDTILAPSLLELMPGYLCRFRL